MKLTIPDVLREFVEGLGDEVGSVGEPSRSLFVFYMIFTYLLESISAVYLNLFSAKSHPLISSALMS